MGPAGMVIVGAGMAGARAVVNLRANDWKGDLTLIGEEALLPYDRPPLSKAFITDKEQPTPINLLDDGILASLQTSFIRSARAVEIDRKSKAVLLEDGRAIRYEKLLIATGAKPRQLTIPGGERALTLRDFVDSDKLRAKLRSGASISIIGGGFIGLEIASSARELGCAVTLVEALPRILMRGVPQDIADVVDRKHRKAGVTMEIGTSLQAIEGDGITLADGRHIKSDIVIAGIGAVPETKLANQSGLTLDNGIQCDDKLQTSDSNIYASGDCCSFPHVLFNSKRIRLEAWRNASDQANVATENMLGASRSYSAVPWFWSTQYEMNLQVAGLPGEGVETVRRDMADDTFIVFHREASGRLVGASGIGPGNTIARDIKLAEMLIAKRAAPSDANLTNKYVALKSLLKG